MKKFGSWLFAIATILCCCLCYSCGDKEPKKNENSEECHEIAYQDDTGIHVVKAMCSVRITDITIFESYSNEIALKEWEYNNKVRLSYNDTGNLIYGTNKPIGSFFTYVSQGSEDKYFGGVRLYYDEGFEDRYGEYCAAIDVYNVLYVQDIYVPSLSLTNENFIISNQTLTRFTFRSIPRGEYIDGCNYFVEGYAEDNLVYAKPIMIRMTFDYLGAQRMNITLLNEGDFTTIKRKDMSDITIRSENILRKVMAENA